MERMHFGSPDESDPAAMAVYREMLSVWRHTFVTTLQHKMRTWRADYVPLDEDLCDCGFYAFKATDVFARHFGYDLLNGEKGGSDG